MLYLTAKLIKQYFMCNKAQSFYCSDTQKMLVQGLLNALML